MGSSLVLSGSFDAICAQLDPGSDIGWSNGSILAAVMLVVEDVQSMTKWITILSD
jgi:hypothetical protein